jgi:hypothetical protein
MSIVDIIRSTGDIECDCPNALEVLPCVDGEQGSIPPYSPEELGRYKAEW